jgi:hypothetical protein
MKLRKVSIALLGILMVSMILIPAVKAATFPELPTTEVTITNTNLTSYDYPFASILSDVPGGYDVTNGPYVGWCVDLQNFAVRGSPYPVRLYSTLSPLSLDLPAALASVDWDKVNHILNNKIGDGRDISQAIWYFINGGAFPTLSQLPSYPYPAPPTTNAQTMVNNALASGDFTPGAGDIVAVICLPTDETIQYTIIELRQPGFPKQFTAAFTLDEELFEAPLIFNGGLDTSVVGIHSGPNIYWIVTYYFANTPEYLGDQYDGEGHYFQMWDKWGGNLMVLDSPPVAFDGKFVDLDNGEHFNINPSGYKNYVGPGLSFTDSNGNPATATLHTGDQQEKTNPGKGKGTDKDGKSYDMDIVWEIGWLEPTESASFSIYLAPGINPGNKLAFSSPGYYLVNTGPRTRVYADAEFTDFMYAISRTIQLGVLVTE